MIQKISYLGSYPDFKLIPYVKKEVAFIGRSNVGKSSLINAICEKKICLTSKKPGKTKMINLFCDQNRSFGIVDLPGYGFAKVNQDLKELWHKAIPNYIINRESLNMIYLLIDCRIGLMDSDLSALDIILSSSGNVRIIITKMDKLSPSEEKDQLEKIREQVAELGVENEPYFTSSKDAGKYELKKIKREVFTLLGI